VASSTLETSQPTKAKPRWIGAAFVVLGLAILIGLGVWQLERLRWKQDLLAHVAKLQNAPPVPLASIMGQPPAALDFVRVSLACPDLEMRPSLHLHALKGGDEGKRFITACQIGDRSVLVDRGFLEDGDEAAPERVDLGQPLVGVLRISGGRNFVTPLNDAKKNIWYWRDVPAMAEALSAPRPLPVTLMMETPAPVGGGPFPSALPEEIPNRHLEYALTWFGLAAALAGVYIAMLLRRRPS
jgi:surfeit locus 1 family protein